MPIPNNVTRMLDQRAVQYQAFILPAEKLGARETARLLNVPLEMVFKTIVARGDAAGQKPLLAVIPGHTELDTRSFAAAAGFKKVHVTTQIEAEKLTGLQAGGISPLALLNQRFSVWLDKSALALQALHVSGGQRGVNIKLSVQDFLALTKARLAAIARPSQKDEEN